MPPHWTKVRPVLSTAIVTTTYVWSPGQFPPAGPELDTIGKPRVLIGWIHQDDTPEGLMRGQIYTCVIGNSLMIYDSTGNRSPNPGEVVFCGLANFTMVRMFHPYWAKAGPGGTLPRDMAWGVHLDKANLRRLYHECLVAHYGNNAAGQPIYQIPAPRARPLPAPVVTTPKEGEGSSSNLKGPKKPRKPRGPNKPKNPQATPGSAKKRSAPYANEVHMNYPPNKRLAAANDGDSIKSESRSTSIVNSAPSTPTRQEPEQGRIDLTTAAPDGNSSSTNTLGAIDLTGMEEEMDRQTGGPSSSPQLLDDSASATPVDDYYVEDREDRGETDRLLAEWQQYLTPSQLAQARAQGYYQSQGWVQGRGTGHGTGQGQGQAQAQAQIQDQSQGMRQGQSVGHGDDQAGDQRHGQGEDQGHASSTSSSSPVGNHGNHGNDLQNSIEIDDGHDSNEQDQSQEQEQNAQLQILPQGRDSESTAVADQDMDMDMQMIGMGEDGDGMKVFDDDLMVSG